MEEAIQKGFRIYYHKNLKKYMVNIWFKGNNIHVGYYDNFDDAIIERDKAIIELYGDLESYKNIIVKKKRGKLKLEKAIEENKIKKETLNKEPIINNNSSVEELLKGI